MRLEKVSGKVSMIKAIGIFIVDENVFKELGEPILYKDDMSVIVALNKVRSSVFNYDTPIGFIGYYPKGDNVVLNYLYVIPSMRGRGVASKLINAFEEDLKQFEDLEEVRLTATDSAMPMYVNKGYELVKSYVKFHKMKKTLINEKDQ
jgi:GNAT superfamily N-acetyltransferase